MMFLFKHQSISASIKFHLISPFKMKITSLQALLLASLLLLTLAAEDPYRQVIHNSDQNAKCLDGTSPAMYVHEGGDSNKFLIFFMGGGYCTGTTLNQVLESCYRRSQSDLGSSKNLPPIFYSLGGYLSTDPSISRFATWTKFIVFYCDGAHHQGYNQDAILYKDTKLYFRGEANVKSHLKWITSNYQFANAEKVLLTGASSGGIATFSWSNYVRSLLTDPNALYTVADSGVFMNITNPYTGEYTFSEQSKALFKVSNANAFTPLTSCNSRFEGEEYRCLFLQNSFAFVQGRFMIINSQYDEVGLEEGVGINCLKNGVSGKTLSNCSSTELKFIEVYRKEYLSFVSNFMQFAKNSAWTISCCTHSYACYGERYDVPEQKVPSITGLTVKDAIDLFVFQDQRVSSVDSVAWPENQPCAY